MKGPTPWRTDPPRPARTLLAVALLLLSLLPLASQVAVAQDILHVAEGETVVITEDTSLNTHYISVAGTLVIDGADFSTVDRGKLIIMDTYINVTGCLRIVNGSWFAGMYWMRVHQGASVEIVDSRVSGGSSHKCSIHLEDASLRSVRSTIDCDGFLHGERSDVVLASTVVSDDHGFYEELWLNLTDRSNLTIEHTNISHSTPLIVCEDATNVSINGSTLSTSAGDLLTVDGADGLHVRDCSLLHGNRGIRAGDVGNVTIEDTRMTGQGGPACHLSWVDAVSVDGLDIDDCADAGLNVTNCTDVSVVDLDVEGVSGDGTGFMTEHSKALSATGVDVRYAKHGVYMVHTDNVTMTHVDVDWCQFYGVRLSYCDGVDVRHLSATEAGIDGLYAGWCRGLEVEEADLDGAGQCGAYLTHTSASMTRVTARTCGQHGVRAATHSVFLVDCDLSYNLEDGLHSVSQGGVGLTDCIVEANGDDGVELAAARTPFLKGCQVRENRGAGVRAHYETRAADVLGCDLEGNGWGVVLNGPGNLSGGSSVTVRDTHIHGSSAGGALNWLDNSSNLDARYCWWGNNTGPCNETRNEGGTGDYIQGGVRFKPWLKLGNLPPIIDGPRDVTVAEEEVHLIFYSATDHDDDPNRISFGLEGEPANVTMDAVSGGLAIAPDDPEVGEHSFLVTATDARGGVGRLRVNLTVEPVNDPPRIVVPDIQLGDDDPVDLQLEARDPDNEPWELAWTMVSGPEFLRLAADGRLTGATSWTDRGHHNVTVLVRDDAGGEDTETIPVLVLPRYEPLRISGLSTTTAFEGRPFSSRVLITHDEEADLGWTFLSNASWMALDEGELRLVGVPGPAHVGTAVVELTVSDQYGGVDTLEATVEVIAVNDPPRWVDLPPEVTVDARSWDMDLSPYVADDDDPVRSLTFSYGVPDRRLDLQGAFLVGEFEEGDRDLNVILVVRDPHGATDEANLTIKVDIPPEPGPAYTVTRLFPWILVVVIASLAVGLLLSRRDRSGEEGGGPG